MSTDVSRSARSHLGERVGQVAGEVFEVLGECLRCRCIADLRELGAADSLAASCGCCAESAASPPIGVRDRALAAGWAEAPIACERQRF
jgi:hypothetical protein